MVAELVAWQIVMRRVETVVVALLDGAVVDAARIVVVVVDLPGLLVVVTPLIVVVVAVPAVDVLPEQPPAGAGIMSPLCPP